MEREVSFRGKVSIGVLCTAVLSFFFVSFSTVGMLKGALAEEFSGAYLETVVESGHTEYVEIVADEGSIEIFEGHTTAVWSYNGSVPGPEIRIQKGDTLSITFTNHLPQESTLHFHGIRVPNRADGVPGITQEAVPPGASFVYEFTPKDAGTFWFHPHKNTSEQLERGLYGTIIVEDAYAEQYSQDVVWVIDDWLLEENYQITPHFVTPHDLTHDGRWGNVVTVNGSLEEVLTGQPGERIRLRLLNASNGRVYALHFKGLPAHVIAVDGMYVKEVFSAQGFVLAPGNRVDVDLTIPNDAQGRSFSLYDHFTQQGSVLGDIVVAGEAVETSQFPFPTNPALPEWSDAFGGVVDEEYLLDARFSASGDIEWTINGEVFGEHSPVELRQGEFTLLRFTNASFRLHPMHLHGQFFKVIARNGQPVYEPYFRDTVLLGPEEVVDIGMVPLDRGVWVQHCHIVEHADAGMMSSIIVR